MKMNKTKTNHPETTGEMAMTYYAIAKSPIDDLLLVTDGSALTGVYFVQGNHIQAMKRRWMLQPNHPVLQEAAKQLREYFTGKRNTFSLPLRLAGTDFQKKIWREIARIPYGETVTYSDLAERAGAPRAVRAAGMSTGQNPVSIIIPCHRVIGKSGSLVGFGGGLKRKRYLLDLENAEAPTLKLA
jgi:methylated-DNA-[protein]-cysteine S-methyltransferase